MLLVSAPAGRVRPLRILVLAGVKDAINDAAARGYVQGSSSTVAHSTGG